MVVVGSKRYGKVWKRFWFGRGVKGGGHGRIFSILISRLIRYVCVCVCVCVYWDVGGVIIGRYRYKDHTSAMIAGNWFVGILWMVFHSYLAFELCVKHVEGV